MPFLSWVYWKEEAGGKQILEGQVEREGGSSCTQAAVEPQEPLASVAGAWPRRL